jgi:hypothetical protein
MVPWWWKAPAGCKIPMEQYWASKGKGKGKDMGEVRKILLKDVKERIKIWVEQLDQKLGQDSYQDQDGAHLRTESAFAST